MIKVFARTSALLPYFCTIRYPKIVSFVKIVRSKLFKTEDKHVAQPRFSTPCVRRDVTSSSRRRTLFASSNAFARRDREQQDEQQLETKETKLNSLLEKIKPSATHTADGLPSLPVYEDPLTGEQTIMLHPATILNGKHVGYSKKRILEEIKEGTVLGGKH